MQIPYSDSEEGRCNHTSSEVHHSQNEKEQVEKPSVKDRKTHHVSICSYSKQLDTEYAGEAYKA